MRFTSFIRQMFTAQSGISTKRVGGLIGMVAIIVWITYVVVVDRSIPDIAEIFTICVFSMLGLDTIPKSIDTFRRHKKCNETKQNNV